MKVVILGAQRFCNICICCSSMGVYINLQGGGWVWGGNKSAHAILEQLLLTISIHNGYYG